MRPRGATSTSLPAHLEKTTLHLRRQFVYLYDGRQRLHQQPQGDEIDLNAWLDFQVERRHGGFAQPGLFLEQRPHRRGLAYLLLADLSMSTETYLGDQQRVIDNTVDSLLLFGEALQALEGPFAPYGFSSVCRQQVCWRVPRDFDEGYDGEVHSRVLALSPGYYTQVGAATRQASQVLGGQPQKHRLLLLLSDDKLNNLDHYEGRYGIEDIHQAMTETRSQGLVPFCITIDKEAAGCLPCLFGTDDFVLVEHVGQLPERLLQLYRRLHRWEASGSIARRSGHHTRTKRRQPGIEPGEAPLPATLELALGSTGQWYAALFIGVFRAFGFTEVMQALAHGRSRGLDPASLSVDGP